MFPAWSVISFLRAESTSAALVLLLKELLLPGMVIAYELLTRQRIYQLWTTLMCTFSESKVFDTMQISLFLTANVPLVGT